MPLDQFGYWTPPATVNPVELHRPLPSGYICQARPEAPMQSPGELLKEFYKDKNVRDWTNVADGILRQQQFMHNKFPQYAAQPIGSSGLVGQWPRPYGLPAVPVPVYGTFSPDGPLVSFKNQGNEGPSRGVRLIDIYQDSQLLECADASVLTRARGKNLNFVIAWPGYEPQWFAIYKPRVADGGLTRLRLAQQIATAYGHFFKNVEEKKLLPNELGFYNIALHQGQNAKADSLGIQLSQLHLLKFWLSIEGYWVSEIEIV